MRDWVISSRQRRNGGGRLYPVRRAEQSKKWNKGQRERESGDTKRKR
jgi:hypothetical protein